MDCGCSTDVSLVANYNEDPLFSELLVAENPGTSRFFGDKFSSNGALGHPNSVRTSFWVGFCFRHLASHVRLLSVVYGIRRGPEMIWS